MASTVRVSESELKRAKKFPGDVREWIIRTIAALEGGPGAAGAERLKDTEYKLWKLRYRDYRIVVRELPPDRLDVVVIDHRRQVYERYQRLRRGTGG